MRSAPALILAALAPAGIASEVTIGPSRDTTIYSESGAESNGSGWHLFAGVNGFGEVRRALLRFDVAAALPAGASITQVELTLYMSRTQAGPHEVRLQRALADWGEGASDAIGGEGAGAPAATGDATWTRSFFPTVAWTALGGDLSGGPSASQTVNQVGSYTWSSTEMAADAQRWLDAPAGNFGWFLVNANEQDTPTAKRFESRENGTASDRPRLRIVYDAPCGGSATSYCVAAPSSTGAGARIGRLGSLSVTANAFALDCVQMPPGTFHVFYFGSTTDQQPFGNGFRCVGGALVRLNPPATASASGFGLRPVDFTAPPALGNITGGSTRHFQCWYRNPAAGGAGFNLSDGLSVTFCP